jgi:hypothetical protein
MQLLLHLSQFGWVSVQMLDAPRVILLAPIGFMEERCRLQTWCGRKCRTAGGGCRRVPDIPGYMSFVFLLVTKRCCFTIWTLRMLKLFQYPWFGTHYNRKQRQATKVYFPWQRISPKILGFSPNTVTAQLLLSVVYSKQSTSDHPLRPQRVTWPTTCTRACDHCQELLTVSL